MNGRIAHRAIRGPGYSIFFQAEGREIAVPDPVQSLVREFCTAQMDAPSSRMGRLEVQRLRALETLMAVYPGNPERSE
jgi:hypothetical protein